MRALITTGYVILGLAMWYFASFNLFTDYRREALARAIQGFGLAFLFIPISQLALLDCSACGQGNKAIQPHQPVPGISAAPSGSRP